VGKGLTGAYKVWINGTLTHDFSGLQTTSNANGWPWDSTELGGPGWDVQGGSHVWGLDQIRFTTTNIAAADGLPPPAPASLNATATGTTTTSLSWAATTDSAGVTGYRVERCPGSSCGNFVEIAATAGVTYPDSGLTAGSVYRYRVRASDAIGNL